MTFFTYCNACNKKKLYISKRSYIVPKLSKDPITYKGEMCGKCYKGIKKNVINNINNINNI